MAMVCAQCNQVFNGNERKCPRCGVSLLFQQHGVKQLDETQPPIDPRNRWQQTPWGRIVVSVVISQGMVFCFQQLSRAWFQASAAEAGPIDWNTPTGMIWLHSFQAFALFFCGMLAGANQERGITSGGLVGLWSGLFFLAIHRASHEWMGPVLFYSQPFLLLFWGLLGGFVGYRIWKPVPLFGVVEDLGKSTVTMPRMSKKLMKGPIHVVRVLIGSGVALAGAVFAKELIDMVMRQSGGMLRITSYSTERLVLFQAIGLAAFVGGCIAGSSSRNGFKQGLCAGVLTGFLYLGVQLANPKSVIEITIFATCGIALACLAGGWFGALLFPPLAKPQPKGTIPY